jgi:MFS family permease
MAKPTLITKWKPLQVFNNRDYRGLWCSDVLISLAEQMEFVVLAWFVLIETDSPFLLGLFGALRWFGTLLSPFYGAVVDRLDRRRLLLLLRFSFIGLSASVLVLAVSESLEVWHVFVVIILTGLGRAFNSVTRDASLPDIVAGGGLLNAVAVNSVGISAAHMVGPLIGGALLEQLNLSWVYAAILTFFIISALVAFQVRLPAATTPRQPLSVLKNVTEATVYIGRDRLLLGMMLLALVVNFAAFPLTYGMLPVFARDVLNTDAFGLSVLLWASATGTFLGSVIVASLSKLQKPGRFALIGMFSWYGLTLIFSQSHWFAASLTLLFMAGLVQAFSQVTSHMLLIRVTPNQFRGRVMGMRSMAVYGLPLGLLMTGAIADLWSAPGAVAINASIGLALTLVIVLKLRDIWRYRNDAA